MLFLLWNRVFINIWDAAGFQLPPLSCHYITTVVIIIIVDIIICYLLALLSSVIMQPLVLFNAIKIVPYQWPHAVLRLVKERSDFFCQG